jgi:hypothetical protein
VIILLCITPAAVFSNYMSDKQLSNLEYYCYVEDEEIKFCSNRPIEKPNLIFRLPLLKSINLKNGVHAFRVMAEVENLTANTLLSASIKVSFGEKEDESLNILIYGPVNFRDKSSVDRSHLIRADVPAINSLYNAISNVYYDSNVSEIQFSQATSKFTTSKQNQ